MNDTTTSPRSRYTAALQQRKWDQGRAEFDPPIFALPLVTLRALLDLSVTDLAKQLGVSRPFLSRIESGERGMSDELRARVYVVIGEHIAGNR